jgi:hypothetical protein
LTPDLAPRRRLQRRRCLQRRYHRHVERRTGGRARRPRAGRKDLACGRRTKHVGGGDSGAREIWPAEGARYRAKGSEEAVGSAPFGLVKEVVQDSDTVSKVQY